MCIRDRAEGIPKGLYITEAIADSPAYLAGIQAGDIPVSYTHLDVYKRQVQPRV